MYINDNTYSKQSSVAWKRTNHYGQSSHSRKCTDYKKPEKRYFSEPTIAITSINIEGLSSKDKEAILLSEICKENGGATYC